MLTFYCDSPAWHRNEETISTIDDLQVAYDKGVIKGDTTERAKSIVRTIDVRYSDFGNSHGADRFDG